MLYGLLFLLYAESRDLLPVREAAYLAVSLKRIKEEVALKAGAAEDEILAGLERAYSPRDTGLYDRLSRLCQVMDKGDPALNVPTYNGGLFLSKAHQGIQHEHRMALVLLDYKVPDFHLAQAIDRLARDQDDKSLAQVFIDYKSLEVRHLGSIYEGLLEFKLKVAAEDLTPQNVMNSTDLIANAPGATTTNSGRSVRRNTTAFRHSSFLRTTRTGGRSRASGWCWSATDPTWRPASASMTRSIARSRRRKTVWSRSLVPFAPWFWQIHGFGWVAL